jgi:integrase
MDSKTSRLALSKSFPKAKTRGRPRKRSKLIRERWPRVRRVFNHGLERFVVDSRRVDFPDGGQHFYDTEAEAIAVAEKLHRDMRNEGARGFAILSLERRADAAEAIAILIEAGYENESLVDAARAHVLALKAKRARETGLSVEEALELYLDAKRAEHARGKITRLTLYDLESKARHIRRGLGGKRLAEIDHSSVEAFLAALHLRPRGEANVRLKLSQFLNFCVRKKWISSNSASEIKVKVPQYEVEILTVQQAKELLRSAEASDQPEDVVPYIALSLFAGLRPGEAQQLSWERINFNTKQIEVTASTSKTRETRFVRIEQTLAHWLLRYRKKNGPIAGTNFAKLFRAIKAAAGFGTGTDALYSWHKDVLRHCFGSYWLPLYGDRARLAEEMGNSITVIKTHYRRAIPRQMAAPFWQLRPNARTLHKPVSPASDTAKIVAFPTQSPSLAGNN